MQLNADFVGNTYCVHSRCILERYFNARSRDRENLHFDFSLARVYGACGQLKVSEIEKWILDAGKQRPAFEYNTGYIYFALNSWHCRIAGLFGLFGRLMRVITANEARAQALRGQWARDKEMHTQTICYKIKLPSRRMILPSEWRCGNHDLCKFHNICNRCDNSCLH